MGIEFQQRLKGSLQIGINWPEVEELREPRVYVQCEEREINRRDCMRKRSKQVKYVS